MKRNYIGLANTLHDSAMAVVDSNGKIVFAEATERYIQNKRSINCPPDFFQRVPAVIKEYCEPGAELVVAQSWSEKTPDVLREQLRGLKEQERRAVAFFGEVPAFMKTHLSSREFLYESQIHSVTLAGTTLKYELNQSDDGVYIGDLRRRTYDHHDTHAAAACFTSPFKEAVCAIVDGMGEGSSTCCYAYTDGKIEKIADVPNTSSGSLGLFYTFLCVTCGFGHLTGEEWKVMGLAPYGKHDQQIYDIFDALISVDGLCVKYAPDATMLGLLQKIHKLKRKRDESPYAAADVARAGQAVFCNVYFKLLQNLHDLGISENLIIGGGCALNSSANGRVLENTKFKNLHVFSAPGDDGNAIGAAMLAFIEDYPGKGASSSPQSPYLGSALSSETLARVRQFGPPRQFEADFAEICRRTARALADGKIVGWAQGRAEFGPRALGNRSILADPRDPDMKNKINSRIKFRESFRPFAPAILHEHGPEYFVNYQESPYMERTLRFKESVIGKVPAIVHEDGTGRLQTVKEEWNERFYQLIRAFYDITAIPLVLNTSFNVMGKPIIHTVEDALAVFYTSGLDLLVINDVLIEK